MRVGNGVRTSQDTSPPLFMKYTSQTSPARNENTSKFSNKKHE